MRKKNKNPAMPMDWSAYFGDTHHLSALEHGAYMLLIGHYWQHRGLPSDDVELAEIAKLTTAEWASSRPRLYRLFKLGDWKHKRIEFELTESARVSAAGRTAGIASGASRRKKSAAKTETKSGASNDRSTIGQRSANDRRTPKKVSKEERTLDPRGSNGADAPRKLPVYTDSKHELWGEGVPILVQLGLTDGSARSNIGRWLKDTKDDAVGVLGAIQRAREHRVIDPVPWITRAIKPGSKADVAESRSLVAAGRRAAASIARAPDLGDDAGQPLLRLLPQG